MTFKEHKEQTAQDCEQIADVLKNIAISIREGDMGAFDKFWIEGGTPEGDAKIAALREMIVLRYLYREEEMEN